MDKKIAEQSFNAGYEIFKEESMGTKAYLIVEGEVEISRKKGKKKLVIARIGKDTIFGEMALIDKSRRSATATATQKTKCLVLDREVFEKQINQLSPFLQGIFRILCKRIRQSNDANLEFFSNVPEPEQEAKKPVEEDKPSADAAVENKDKENKEPSRVTEESPSKPAPAGRQRRRRRW